MFVRDDRSDRYRKLGAARFRRWRCIPASMCSEGVNAEKSPWSVDGRVVFLRSQLVDETQQPQRKGQGRNTRQLGLPGIRRRREPNFEIPESSLARRSGHGALSVRLG